MLILSVAIAKVDSEADVQPRTTTQTTVISHNTDTPKSDTYRNRDTFFVLTKILLKIIRS